MGPFMGTFFFFREPEFVRNKNSSISRKYTISECLEEVNGNPSEQTTPRRAWKFQKQIYLPPKFPFWDEYKHGGYEKKNGDTWKEEKEQEDAPKMGRLH